MPIEVSGTAAEEGDDDNPIVNQPAALLIADDPTGETAVRFTWAVDLTHEDYERYRKALHALADIRGSNMMAYVHQAGLAMVRELGEAYKAIYENRISHVQMDDIEEWCARLRTAVLGLCSSIHHHQEQSYIEVRRKFPDPPPINDGRKKKDQPVSAEHAEMRRAFNELYDNCFGYRYLHKLRNAMVHYSMFACGIGAESHRHEGQNIHWFELTLNRSILLEQRSFLNATLRRELKELPEDPDLVSLMNGAFVEMMKTNKRVVEILHPDFEEICETVVEFDNLFGDQAGVRCISCQRSRELRRPFKFAYHPVTGQVILTARKYVAERQGADG
ncbi:hypothetical protein MJO55_21570 [Mycolicibacterium rufum]|uniref:Uncharacterized protein n=1 Tax=Mycolicibacterium rufum TaxID=318424 RepID=A0A9X3BIM9_9MYCO|nr:hypothetical protein [Mycolicibacterium rufum]MCV7072653.1 hypothetical protein [Mycolicibacterium rufum]ULP35816.1 hypothetical protein MJO55_21570 [Mycolicibacterium rufum]